MVVVMPSWLADAWRGYLGPWLGWVWALPLWQPSTLILITGGWAAYKWRRVLARRILAEDDRALDVALLRKLDAMASETFVDSMINARLFSSADLDDAVRLWEFLAALRRIENRYLDTVVRRRAETMVRELAALRAFTGRTFFSIGGNRIKFRPDRIDSDVWDREHAELDAKTDEAWSAYRAYREAVKDRLRV